ncbi:MAG: heavy-metal-associated domain-containing protein [Anaerolineae bacterium]
MKTIKLIADNISCPHCVMAIKRELASADGVRVLDVDVATKVVTLEYADEPALEQALAALTEIGYPARAAS